MESIGAREAETRLRELLDRACRGETFEITRDGRAVAHLVPARQHDVPDAAEAIRAMLALRGTVRNATVDTMIAAIEDGRRV